MQDSGLIRYHQVLWGCRKYTFSNTVDLAEFMGFIPAFFLSEVNSEIVQVSTSSKIFGVRITCAIAEILLMQPCPYEDPGESHIGTGFKELRNVSSCPVTKPKENYNLQALTNQRGLLHAYCSSLLISGISSRLCKDCEQQNFGLRIRKV